MQVIFITRPNMPEDVANSIHAAIEHLQVEGIKSRSLPVNENRMDEEVLSEEDTLYLTDDTELLAYLIPKELPVVALSHAYNADADLSGAAYVFSEPEEIDADSYIKAYERQMGLPWQILETKRLLIRETTVEDVDCFYEIYKDPSMTKYMEGLFANPEDEKRYMRDYIKNVYALMGFGVWTVILKETGEVIGRAGFSIRSGFDKPELGFLIGVKHQGQGYAQEALQAILTYGREILGFETVQALVKEGNEESVHILKKLGFEIEGLAKAEENIYGDSYQGIDVRAGQFAPADAGESKINKTDQESRGQRGIFIEMVYRSI